MKAAAQVGRTDVGAVALSRGGGRVAEQLDQTCIAGDGRNAGGERMRRKERRDGIRTDTKQGGSGANKRGLVN